MRLIDLDPHWVSFNTVASVENFKFYFGVSFLCPCQHCKKCPTCGRSGRRVAVSFWPPIDPDKWEGRITLPPHDHYHRRVSGDTFDALTLEPSIKFADHHWHGRIVNGEMIDAP